MTIRFPMVLNLRSLEEEGFLDDEGERAKAAGLDYVNIPVKPDNINEDLADRVLQQRDWRLGQCAKRGSKKYGRSIRLSTAVPIPRLESRHRPRDADRRGEGLY